MPIEGEEEEEGEEEDEEEEEEEEWMNEFCVSVIIL